MDLKETEKKRELSDAEKRRLEKFEDTCFELEQKGYKKTELTVSIVKANIFALILGIPVFAAGLGLFFLKFGKNGFTSMTFREFIIWIIGLFVITALHEFIHGFTWGLYSEHYFSDIEFGFMKKYLTPYCTCTEPLSKRAYVAGALMPLIVLGILPAAASMFNGSYIMLLTGLIMIVAAAGDIMIAYYILTYRTGAEEVLYYDHPTMAGGVIFER